MARVRRRVGHGPRSHEPPRGAACDTNPLWVSSRSLARVEGRESAGAAQGKQPAAHALTHNAAGDAPVIAPREHQADDQQALAWVGEPITAAPQGMTLDYVGGWHTFNPNQNALERAWRVLYDIPDSMIYLLTSPQEQWVQVLMRWERHRHERG